MKLTLDLPSGLSPADFEAARRAALEAAVLKLYQSAAISAGRAAEMLGIPLEQFLLWASSQGVAVFDRDEASLRDDVEAALRAAKQSP